MAETQITTGWRALTVRDYAKLAAAVLWAWFLLSEPGAGFIPLAGAQTVGWDIGRAGMYFISAFVFWRVFRRAYRRA